MKESFIYRPYKTDAKVLVLIVPIVILGFVSVGFCILQIWLRIFFAVLSIVCTYFIKTLFVLSNVLVEFDEKGLRIIGGNYKDYRYLSWQKLSNASYFKTYRGFRYLVLSQKELSCKEVKALVDKSSICGRVCIDDAVVFGMDASGGEKVREFVEKHVEFIHPYY